MANIRLVSYGSAPYRVRQWLLNKSATASGAVREYAAWDPCRLVAHGFPVRCTDISLAERGGGWWAWKPYVISAELEDMKDGDWLLYCDVGRTYPAKLIHRPLRRLLDWCVNCGQVALPGVHIPWFGPMRHWTKRDAFVLMDCDEKRYHDAIPIQASFSLWQACDTNRAFVAQWLDGCADRRLVTDDPNTCGQEDLDGFREHRYDQSLLTLLCLKHGLRGFPLGADRPDYNEKNPAEVARILGESSVRSVDLRAIQGLAQLYAGMERIPRIWTGWRYRNSLAIHEGSG